MQLKSRCYDTLVKSVLRDTSNTCSLTPGILQVLELLTKQSSVETALIVPKGISDLDLIRISSVFVQPEIRLQVETLRKLVSEVSQ